MVSHAQIWKNLGWVAGAEKVADIDTRVTSSNLGQKKNKRGDSNELTFQKII